MTRLDEDAIVSIVESPRFAGYAFVSRRVISPRYWGWSPARNEAKFGGTWAI